MNTFKPSKVAYETTAILDRGQIEQPNSAVALAGQAKGNLRNAQYQTEAEQVGKMAHFMAHRKMSRESSKDYEVLPGGKTVYFNGAEKKLRPYGPEDLPLPRMAPPTLLQPEYVKDPPRSSSVLTLPDDRDVFGHDSKVSTKLKGYGGNSY